MACAIGPRLASFSRHQYAIKPAGITQSTNVSHFVSPGPRPFLDCSISAPRTMPISRPLIIMNNAKKCMGATREGSNRKTKTTSGFRTRKRTPGGRKVLKARRRKGRKILCPASVRKDGKHRV